MLKPNTIVASIQGKSMKIDENKLKKKPINPAILKLSTP